MQTKINNDTCEESPMEVVVDEHGQRWIRVHPDTFILPPPTKEAEQYWRHRAYGFSPMAKVKSFVRRLWRGHV